MSNLYPNPTQWVDDSEPDINAANLNNIEQGIERIANAVISQIMDDPDKIASMAALFAVNQKVDQLNSDLSVANIKDSFSYDANSVLDFTAYKVGKLVHVCGTVQTNTTDVAFTMSNNTPRFGRVAFAVNYNSWRNKDVQCITDVTISNTQILVKSGGAPYTYTKFDLVYEAS